MEIKEFKEILAKEVSGLKEDMGTKTTEEINGSISKLEEKMTDIMAEKLKATSESMAEQKALAEELEKSVKALGAKLQEKNASQRKANATLESEIKRLVEEKVKPVGSVTALRKGEKYAMNIKAVGDMTLGNNLTGDAPRDYDNMVKMVPGQLLHFADLIGTIPISGGTYTFPRESGSEGGIAYQTEGATKSQIDYDFTMVDVSTDFLAGYTVYSKKMANNLPYLEGFLPQALRRDYLNQESAEFNTVLAAGATASGQIITGKNKVEMLVGELSDLETINENPNASVIRPADWYDILVTEKSSGAGYGLPGVVTFEGGTLRINGIPLFKANWLGANKYYVGDWSVIRKIVTEGLSLSFSTEDSTNFRDNNITARIEAQIALAIHRPSAVNYGDFTAV